MAGPLFVPLKGRPLLGPLTPVPAEGGVWHANEAARHPCFKAHQVKKLAADKRQRVGGPPGGSHSAYTGLVLKLLLVLSPPAVALFHAPSSVSVDQPGSSPRVRQT